MAYRFSDTLKWNDEWFIELQTFEKLLFMYFCDNCDVAGFFELSLRKICFDTRTSEAEILGAIEGLSRGLIFSLDRRTILVKNFIKHQKNLPLNFKNNAHVGIMTRFKMYEGKFQNLTLDSEKGFTQLGAKEPLDRGTGKGKDKGNYTSSIEAEEKKSKLILSMTEYFGYMAPQFSNQRSQIVAFTNHLLAGEWLNSFSAEFECYKQLKEVAGFPIAFKNFVGSQSKQWKDGRWSENWTHVLAEYKNKQPKQIQLSSNREPAN